MILKIVAFERFLIIFAVKSALVGMNGGLVLLKDEFSDEGTRPAFVGIEV